MGVQIDIKLTEASALRVEAAFAALSNAGSLDEPAQQDHLYVKSIAKELAMAERLAFDLRRRAIGTVPAIDVPDLEELFDAMEAGLAQRIDDQIGRIQSLARHNMFAMSAIAEQTQKRLNLVMAICVVQALATVAFAIWR